MSFKLVFNQKLCCVFPKQFTTKTAGALFVWIKCSHQYLAKVNDLKTSSSSPLAGKVVKNTPSGFEAEEEESCGIKPPHQLLCFFEAHDFRSVYRLLLVIYTSTSKLFQVFCFSLFLLL